MINELKQHLGTKDNGQKSVEIGYKVVTNELRSAILANVGDGIQYVIGKYVRAAIGMRKLKLHLTAFRSCEYAKSFIDGLRKRFPEAKLVLYECELKDIVSEKLPKPLFISGTLERPLIWPHDPCPEDQWSARWAEGTVMAKAIKLIKEIPHVTKLGKSQKRPWWKIW